MVHKSSLCLIALALFALPAEGARRSVSVIDSSTSGRLIRVNIGASAGINPGDPVLFSEGEQKVAAGRVVRVDGGSSIVAVLEKYGSESPSRDFNYDLLYGEPFPEADNLPDYVADRENETTNPNNEKFFTPEGEEINPELDDENYTPETVLRPKYPEPRSYATHNLTVGLGLFRNRSLPTVATADIAPTAQPFTTYQGYSVRYAYSFRSHYWSRADALALLSAEATFGIYSFVHTQTNGQVTQVRVIPVGLELRYMIEVSRMLKLYPYAGYQSNIVSAVNGTISNVGGINGGRLLGGAGAQLVLSQSMDARAEGGSDGFLFGLVVKF